jgi:hypothetical protein
LEFEQRFAQHTDLGQIKLADLFLLRRREIPNPAFEQAQDNLDLAFAPPSQRSFDLQQNLSCKSKGIMKV